MSDDSIQLKVQRSGRGKATVTLAFPDGTSHTDKLDITDSKQRTRFIAKAIRGKKGITKTVKHDLAAALEKEAAGGNGDGGRPSQADVLLKLALGAELFHTPGGNDSEAFASVVVNGHRETWPINGNGFRRWLSRLYYEETGRAPAAQSLQDAINVVAGRAQFQGPELPVAVRLAVHDGAIYLDLADSDWRVVRVAADGWAVSADCPVRFVRRRGLLPLPVPVAGGSVDELRPLVNLPDDASWRLTIAWLIGALRPGRPFPVLAVNGEQGSAKSTLCKMLRALIDPNVAPLRRRPRDDRDLMIAATNGWVVAFDNISGIRDDLSDALCSLATGGGFSTRELYTNDEEKLIDVMRPIITNGIEESLTRSDLLDRAITLTLPAIPDDARLEEDEVWRQFDAARPRVLGALLTAVSGALRNKASVRLTSKPRMADFATWIVAAEPALGWPAGAFLSSYMANREGANAVALDSSIVAQPILALVEKYGTWDGTVKQLLAELEEIADEKTQKGRDWPTGPRKLGGELRRLAPPLRRAGINLTFHERSRAGVPVTLERAGATRSRHTQSTLNSPGAGQDGERREHRERHPQPDSGCFGQPDEVFEWTA